MLTKSRSGVFVLDPMRPGQRGQHSAVCKILAFDTFKEGEKEQTQPNFISSAVCELRSASVRNLISQAVLGKKPPFSSLHGLSPALINHGPLPGGEAALEETSPQESHRSLAQQPGTAKQHHASFSFPNYDGRSPCWLYCWKSIHWSQSKPLVCSQEAL